MSTSWRDRSWLSGCPSGRNPRSADISGIRTDARPTTQIPQNRPRPSPSGVGDFPAADCGSRAPTGPTPPGAEPVGGILPLSMRRASGFSYRGRRQTRYRADRCHGASPRPATTWHGLTLAPNTPGAAQLRWRGAARSAPGERTAPGSKRAVRSLPDQLTGLLSNGWGQLQDPHWRRVDAAGVNSWYIWWHFISSRQDRQCRIDHGLMPISHSTIWAH